MNKGPSSKNEEADVLGDATLTTIIKLSILQTLENSFLLKNRYGNLKNYSSWLHEWLFGKTPSYHFNLTTCKAKNSLTKVSAATFGMPSYFCTLHQHKQAIFANLSLKQPCCVCTYHCHPRECFQVLDPWKTRHSMSASSFESGRYLNYGKCMRGLTYL